MNMDLFLESYQGDDMRYGQDYDKYVCDDRDTSEYVQMIREMSDEEFEHFGRQLKDKEKNQDWKPPVRKMAGGFLIPIFRRVT